MLFQKKFLDKVIERKPKALFILGSCFEYKIKNNSKIKETHKIKPINNYAKAKNKLRQFVKKKLVKTQILHGADCFMSGARGSPKELFLDNLKVKKKIKLSPFFYKILKFHLII